MACIKHVARSFANALIFGKRVDIRSAVIAGVAEQDR